MMETLSWLVFWVFIAGLLVVGGLLLRGYLTTGSPGGALKDALGGNLFGPRPPKRLEVVDQTNVDGRRKLLLIRRDGIEHLIMTGGPIDVVIETGIGPEGARANGAATESTAAVYQRPPRSLGKAVGET